MTYGQFRRSKRRARKSSKGRFTQTAIGHKHAWRAFKREVGARQARKAQKEERRRIRFETGSATLKDQQKLGLRGDAALQKQQRRSAMEAAQ